MTKHKSHFDNLTPLYPTKVAEARNRMLLASKAHSCVNGDPQSKALVRRSACHAKYAFPRQ
jgi:hypothetical protein